MKFGFIAKHRSVWPVAWLCEALGVSRFGISMPGRTWGEFLRADRRGASDNPPELRRERPHLWRPAGSGGMFWKPACRVAFIRLNA